MNLKQQLNNLGVAEPVAEQMLRQGFTSLTSIQQKALPHVLDGKDVLAKASTGSGKTAAFAIGLLQSLEVSSLFPQALVLCPTRELAEQVADVTRELARKMPNVKVLVLCGGVPVGPQIQSLKYGAHILVATPGRLLAHLRKRRIDMSALSQVVLDEADRMLDLGFEQDLYDIMSAIPAKRQTLLFSATYPDVIKRKSREWLSGPVEVDVTESQNAPDIDFISFKIQSEHSTQAVAAVLSEYQPNSAILFCPTKQMVRDLSSELTDTGIQCMALHGDLEQRARTDVLACFANGSCNVLIATDVAARGLDIDDVELVLNVTLPDNAETLVHRAGRTARAGASGHCVTLVDERQLEQWQTLSEQLNLAAKPKGIASLRFHANRIVKPEFASLCLDAGKKAKVRTMDILGALTKEAQIPGEDIGKIQPTATHTYIAVKLRSVKRAMRFFREGRLKGKRVKSRRLQ